MEEKLVNLFYGSMLHDIGKIVQRATNEKQKHSKIGGEFLEGFTKNREILNQVKFHHYQELSQAKLNKNDLAYITYIADNIASGVDRREEEDSQFQWDKEVNLADIFNKFNQEKSKRYFKPQELDLTIQDVFPTENSSNFNSSYYGKITNRIKENLASITFNEDYMQSLLNLFEATASFIPSSTNLAEVVDISLYDHLKLTAGFSAAIYQYLQVKDEQDYFQALYKNTQAFYREKAFLLTSFDLSGIQEFIYTITSSGAHKQLRSRSFYLDMICEWMVDCLLKECSLTRANLLYSGGGHAYLLLANTPQTVAKIKEVEKNFNQFFLDKFSTKLYVAFGYAEFSAKQVMAENDPNDYRKIFQKVGQKISAKKLSRYSAMELMALNQGGKRSGRECSVCHTVNELVEIEENKVQCASCYQLASFSKNIQRENLFEVNEQAKGGLPLGPNAYLHKIKEEQIKQGKVKGQIYAKNQFYTGLKQGTRLWVADYNQVSTNEFSEYTKREWTKEQMGEVQGIRRMAVMRCDVDDLGYGFIAGFSQQNNGKYNTFSRTATFSRSMSLFFKLYINQFAKNKRLTIIYSGGDDVFLLGAWDDVLAFSVEFRQHFMNWTNGKLTLSTGIGIFPDKTPVNVMARLTGDLEEAAKSNGKDSICLFDEKMTFKYDEFISEVYQGKLPIIRKFFDQETERGKAFIYKLLELIRVRDSQNRISFARLAYYLARLEDQTKSSNKANFQQFKIAMKDWYDDEVQLQQAEMALILYVYETRKDG